MKNVVKKLVTGTLIVALFAVVAGLVTTNIDLPDHFADTTEQTESIQTKEIRKKKISLPAKAGDIVTFGNYPQDKDGTVRPIEWIVLDIVNDQALLISLKGLDCQPYNQKEARSSWKKCSLRTWLNDQFLNTAFTADEQSRIIETKLVTPNNDFSKNVFKREETTDRVYLLTVLEAAEYLDDYYERICFSTEYALTKTGEQKELKLREPERYPDLQGACSWWLRIPGDDKTATGVTRTGTVDNNGIETVSNTNLAVRPVINVDVNAISVSREVFEDPASSEGYVDITDENFPDDVFRRKMTVRFDLNRDGYFSKDEIERVRELYLDNQKVTSIKGLEYFTCLESINVSGNKLSGSIDLSPFSKLVSFKISGNAQPISLSFGFNMKLSSVECSKSFVESINVHDCYNLEVLKCSGNKLTGLDLSFNPILKELNCASNELTGLDVSHNKMLRELNCSNNQIESLDLSYNPGLTELRCQFNHIYGFNLTRNTKLEVIALGNEGFTDPKIIKSKNVVGDLDLSNCTELKYLWLDDCNVRYLDVSNCTKLEKLDLNNNAYSFSRMKWNNLDNLKILSCERQGLTGLDASLFPNLEELYCSNNKLHELRLNNPKLVKVDCSFNGLTELDISQTPIEKLNCATNNLSSLKLNTEIMELDCNRNVLPSLDISNTTKLTKLDCTKNKIKTLSLKVFPKLWKAAKKHNKNPAGFMYYLTLGTSGIDLRVDPKVKFTFK